MPASEIPAGFRDRAYRARRVQNWMLVGLLYSFFYMTRYNFSALAPTLQQVFGWTKNDLGIFETLLPLVYGLSVVMINAQWFHVKERGLFAAIFGVLIRLGLILAFSGVPLIAAYLPWQWA